MFPLGGLWMAALVPAGQEVFAWTVGPALVAPNVDYEGIMLYGLLILVGAVFATVVFSSERGGVE